MNNGSIETAAGGLAGGLLGSAYGFLAPIVDLQIGPIPGWVVGLVFGAAFGIVLGGIIGSIGKGFFSRRSAFGFAIAIIIFAIGRLSDDTGTRMDKTIDFIVGGIFWGAIGAILGNITLPLIAKGNNESESLADTPSDT